MKLKVAVLATTVLAASAGIATAGQNSAAYDYNNSWRWSEQESLLNLQRANLIEQKEGGYYDRDYDSEYNYQSSTSIGNLQQCSEGALCNGTNTGDQGSQNNVNSEGGQSTGSENTKEFIHVDGQKYIKNERGDWVRPSRKD